jgi:hypothetical protein
VTGSAGVMALVLAETVAGGAALLWCTPLWNEVRRGFFTLTSSILAVLAAAGWWSTSAGRVAGDQAGLWSLRLAAVVAVLALGSAACLFARRETLARVLGLVGVAVAAATLAVMAATGRQAFGVSLSQLLAGALFLGAVLDGLLLGHWYLTDRGLTRTPINRFTLLLLVSIPLEVAAVCSGGFYPVGRTSDFNPLLTAGALAPWIALGMVATTGVIAVMVKLTLRGARASAVQAATGFFYLAVVTAFTAEVAVKVRFLPR